MKKKLYLILHNVRSAYNVGAIFRTADGAGVDHIYLTGYTPYPPDGMRPYTTKPERMIIKTALGAHMYVPWTRSEDVTEVIDQLKEGGAAIVALEQGDGSIDHRSYDVQRDTALIVGNEPVGIDEQTLALCDTMIDIPMRGQKKSLNVAVATGIAVYALTE
jgi:tRNA G18 (ribose-2'-O)-methylase SpoU